jgi:hypothetical protein
MSLCLKEIISQKSLDSSHVCSLHLSPTQEFYPRR